MGKIALWILMMWMAVSGRPLHAEIVELAMQGKAVALADFRKGDVDKPAVLLLHGFLQTHSFPTISRLTDSLSGEGYTVLAPTLTLGITHRRQSMACEAINTHTVADGEEEIRRWVQWLKTKKFKNIVLGGHSLGNIYLLSYLSGKPDSRVSKLIGISIIEGSLKVGEHARHGLVQNLRDKIQQGGKAILEEQFSFCRQFRSTPASLLSYMEWGPDRIRTAIDKSRIPVTMIMGSKDDRLGKDWLQRLQKTRAKVIIIDGANHFMDGQYEFDLMDHFLAEFGNQ
jgi:pimeloyl-ACP methyl ester carboxylesterase